MKILMSFSMALALLTLTSCASKTESVTPDLVMTPTERANRQLVAGWLEDIRAIKSGDSRADLLRVFKREGGNSTGNFAYKKCPLIHVDVEFESVGGDLFRGLPTDKIKKISVPFLGYERLD